MFFNLDSQRKLPIKKPVVKISFLFPLIECNFASVCRSTEQVLKRVTAMIYVHE